MRDGRRIPRCRARLFCTLILAAIALTGSSAYAQDNDVVVRRGAEPNLVGKVLKVDDGGITLKRPTGAEYFVTWDRVRDVQTSTRIFGIEPRLDRGADMWRARTRLERQDARLAEPLFDRLFEHYRGQTNPSAYIVAEGVLRCRLARADHVSAVLPALEVIRLRRAGVAPEVFKNLPPVLDLDVMLCPDIPPVWADLSALGRAVRELDAYDARDDQHVANVRLLMRYAMQRQLGAATPEGPDEIDVKTLAESPGLALLHDVVQTIHASSGGDRPELARLIDATADEDVPAWQRGWAYLAIGMARLNSDERETRLHGVVSLLHIPAQRDLAQRHYLAGMALSEAARGLESLGDAVGAGRLRDELQRSHPSHPAALRVTHFANAAPDDAGPSGEDNNE